MKNKKLIFSVLFTGILVLNTFLFTNINENKLQLNSLFTLATAQTEMICIEGECGYLLPEASITCDAPRYGKCNALFSYDVDANAPFGLRTQPVWYFCNFTGKQAHECTYWEETIIQGMSCFFYMMQWM